MIPYKHAAALVEDLRKLLAPACTRIAVAGSIRRKRLQVGDIELVAVSKQVDAPADRQRSLFAAPPSQLPALEAHVEQLIADGRLRRYVRDSGEAGMYGPKWKQLVFPTDALDGYEEPVKVDLFCCALAEFPTVYAIRTGPGDFNRLLMTKRSAGGALPEDLEFRDWSLWRGAQRLRIDTEADYFERLGLPHWPAHERTTETLQRYLGMQRQLRNNAAFAATAQLY